jgi:YD repeat-containing protein
MVAIVSGHGLGINFSSANVAGGRGQLGQAQTGAAGQEVYVNAATGNLVLRERDLQLFDHGLDLGFLHTYNSQGRFQDEPGQDAALGFYARSIRFEGTPGDAGSTLVRTLADGSAQVLTWDAATDAFTDADGASARLDVDRVTFASADGTLTETYSRPSGRLSASAQAGGHALAYDYDDAGLLASVTSDAGERTVYGWQNGRLASVRVETLDGVGAWQGATAVRYRYDDAGRLAAVELDLSPDDDSVADGNAYTLAYTYDGTSDRVATVVQSDGTSLAFTYVQVGTDWRVAGVRDALNNVTRFDYDVAARRTAVTAPDGSATVFAYDDQDRLSAIEQPAADAQVAATAFGYDAAGNLASIVDPLAHAVHYRYDAHGNRVEAEDGAGNVVRWTYTAANQVASETVYLGADTDGGGPTQPQTTRYYYDDTSVPGAHLLRFVVSAAGRVAEYRYDAYGVRGAALAYDVVLTGAAALTGDETVADMAGRVAHALPSVGGAATRTDVQRTDFAYDAHGQLARTTRYLAVAAADLAGVPDGSATTVDVRDGAGRLLSTLGPDGAQTAYTYDALGRVLSATDASGTATTRYDDATRTVTLTRADGSVATRVYDGAGHLVSVTEQGEGTVTTTNAYDAEGRLVMTRTSAGATTWMLYDAAGRQVGEVDTAGMLTEYAYDAAGRRTRTLRHATAVDTSLLADANGAPRAVSLDALRPASDPADSASWQAFDAAGRQVLAIDAAGTVTRTDYDGRGQGVRTTVYAAKADVTALPAVVDAGFAVAADPAQDQVTRHFFDADGNSAGTLDPHGRLTQTLYDGAGRLVETRAFARTVAADLAATGTLAQLAANLRSIDDTRTLYTFDAAGNRTGSTTVIGYPDAAMPGVTDIQGEILQPGEQDDYQFTLTDSNRFFFDGVAGTGLKWTLSNGLGQQVGSNAMVGADDRFLQLQGGTYRLRVSGDQGLTGRYDFRLLGTAAAAPLTVNQAQTGTLAPATQAALYAFDAAAGDQILVAMDGAGGAWRWNLFGPDARLVASSDWNGAAPLPAATAGTYYLSIEGPDGTAPRDYGFTVYRSTPQRGVATVGAPLQAELPVPGAAAVYTFDVAERGWFLLDQLSAKDGAALSYTLTGPAGYAVASGQLNRDEMDYGGVVQLDAGTYRLQLTNAGAAAASVTVRPLVLPLMQAAGATGLALGTDQVRADTLQKVHVTDERALTVAAQLTGGGAHWRVFGPGNATLGGGNLQAGQFATVALAQAGDYYVWIGGDLDNADDITGHIDVAAWSSGSAAAGTLAADADTALTGSLAVAGQRRTVDFDVAAGATWAFETAQMPAGAGWTLTGPAGQVALGTGVDAARLRTGHYTLTVTAGMTSGDFRVVAHPLAAVPLLDGSAVLDGMAAGEVRLFQLAADPLDTFDLLGGGAAAGNVRVQAFDAYGAALGAGVLPTFVPDHAAQGPVYLAVTAQAALTAGATLEVTRHAAVPVTPPSAPVIAIGQDVQADGAGGTPSYAMHLAQDDFVVVSSGASNYVSFNGPLRHLSGYLPGTAVLGWAPAGDYTLSFSNPNIDFSFATAVGSQADVVDAGQDAPVAFAAGQAMRLLRTHATAGTAYALRAAGALDGAYNAAVYDLHGNVLAYGPLSAAGTGNWEVAADQDVYVLVTRDPSVAAAPADATLTLQPLVAGGPVDAGTLDPAADASYDVPVAAGGTNTLAFDVAQDGWWTLANDADGTTFNANWTLAAAGGGFGIAGGGKGASANVYLRHGSYRIQVDGNTTGNVGSARFGLRAIAQTAVGFDAPVDAGTVQPGQQRVLAFATPSLSDVTVDLGVAPGQLNVAAYDSAGGWLNVEAGTDAATGHALATVHLGFGSGFSLIVNPSSGAAVPLAVSAVRTLHDLPAPEGDVVTGAFTPTAPAGVHAYRLHMAADATLLLDTLSTGELHTALLDTATGQFVAVDMWSVRVPAGDYILYTSQSADAAVRWTDSAALPALPAGPVTAAVDPNWVGTYYRFDLAAGEELRVTPTGGDMADVQYSVLDANGNFLFEGDGMHAGTFAAPAAGTYLFELYTGAASARTLDFGTVIDVAPAPQVPPEPQLDVVPGAPFTFGPLNAGQHATLTFDAPPLSEFVLDLGDGGGATGLDFTLRDAEGRVRGVSVQRDETTGHWLATFHQDYHSGAFTLSVGIGAAAAGTAFTATLQRTDTAIPAAPSGALPAGTWIPVPLGEGGPQYGLQVDTAGWYMVDRRGGYVETDVRGVDGSWIDNNGSGWYLEPGQYTVRFSNFWETSADVRMLALADAPVLGADPVGTIHLDAGSVPSYFRLDLAPGARWSWAPIAGAQNVLYTILDADGGEVLRGDGATAAGFAPAAGGSYTLVLADDSGAGMDLTPDMAVTPPGPALHLDLGALDGAVVTDVPVAFDAANQIATIEFDVAASGLWSLGGLTDAGDVLLGLDGPLGNIFRWNEAQGGDASGGFLVPAQGAAGPAADPVAFLAAGHYLLRLYDTGAAGRTVALALRPLAAATAATPGTPVDLGGMAVGDERLLAVDLQANDGFAASLAGTGSDFVLETIDASGGTNVASGADGISMQSQWAGAAWLLVRRVAADGGAAAATLDIELSDGPDATPLTALAPGAGADWVAPVQHFEFDVAADGWVTLDWENGSYTDWTLEGPDRVRRGATAGGVPQYLAAGHYRMTLTNGGGPVSFRLSGAGQTTALPLDTASTLDLSRAVNLFDLDLDGSMETWLRLSGTTSGNDWTLYDAAGNMAGAGSFSSTGLQRLTGAAASGHYLLVVKRQPWGATSQPVAFVRTPRAGVPLALDRAVSGTFTGSYQTQYYTVTLDAPAQLVFTGLTGANVSVLDAFGRNAGTVWNSGSTPSFALGAGTYRVAFSNSYLSGNQGAAYSYAAHLRQGAAPLAIGGSTTVTWTNGETDSLQLPLQAGQGVWIATTNPIAYGQYFDYRVLGPDGQSVTNGTLQYYGSSGFAIDAPLTGTYTIQMFARQSSTPMTGSTVFTATQAARPQSVYTPGTVVGGTLATPADRASYTFTLDAPTAMWLETDAYNYTVNLVRTDEPGAQVPSFYAGQRGWFTLGAGSYAIRFRSDATAPGSYRLASVLAADVPALTPGATVRVTSDQGRAASVFRISASAGQALFIDPRTVSGGGSQYWNLYASDGTMVANGSGSQRQVVTATDDYILSISGSYNDTAPREVDLTVSAPADPVVPLTLGDEVAGTVAQPGANNTYTFTLDHPTTVVLDPRGGNATLLVQNAQGNQYAWIGSGQTGAPTVLNLEPGAWRVIARGDGAATPSYAFAVLDAQAAPVLGGAEALQGSAPGNAAATLYRVDLLSGLQYTCALDAAGTQLHYKLFSASNTWLADGYSSNGPVKFNAPQGEPLYMLVEQTGTGADPVDFTATFHRPATVAGTLELGQAQTVTLPDRADSARLAFDVTAAGWVELNNLRASAGTLQLRIIGADGNQVGGTRYVGGGPDTWTMWLPAGRYSLAVDPYSLASASTLSFTALQAVQTDVRSAGTPRVLQQPDGAAPVVLWNLGGMTGDKLHLEKTTWDGASGTVQVIDPNGTVRYNWSATSGTAFDYTLDRNGAWLVRVTRPAQADGSSNAFGLTATVGTAGTVDPVQSTFNAAGTIAAGASQSFQFTLDAPGLWYVDRNSLPDWTGSYQSFALTDANGTSYMTAYDRPAWLAAGTYTIKLTQNSYASTYDFTVRSLDGTAAPLLRDQAISTALPDVASLAYVYDAHAGDTLRFDQFTAGQFGGRRYTLLNRYGQVLAAATLGTSVAPFTVTGDGPLYLLIGNPTASSPGLTLGFALANGNVVPVGLTLDEPVTGTLDAHTPEAAYTFTLDHATTVQLQPQTVKVQPEDTLYWNLRDSAGGGTVASGSFNWDRHQDPASTDHTMTLAAGTYTLNLRGYSSRVSPFGFTLRALDTVPVLASGQPVQGTLQPTGERATYAIDLQAGDNLFLAFSGLAPVTRRQDPDYWWSNYINNYTARVEVVDPAGRTVYLDDVGADQLVATMSGRYTIVLGEVHRFDDPTPYTMTAYVNHPQPPRVIDVNASVQQVDLTVADLAVAPAGSRIESGGWIDVAWTTRNGGVQATSGDFGERVVVRNADTGAVVLQAAVPYREAVGGPLAPGASAARSVRLRLPDGPAGTGNLVVSVETDADNAQPEVGAALGNNVASLAVTSVLAPYADLQVDGLALAPASDWQAGDSVSVSWNAVNRGSGAAVGAWSERVQLLNLTTGTVVADVSQLFADQNLDAGAQAARSAVIAWPAGLDAVGRFELRVTVDALNQVAEYTAAGSPAEDNTAVRALVVGPSLVARDIGLAQTDPRDGDTVTLAWTDVNQGRVAAPANFPDRVTVRRLNDDGTPGAIVLDTSYAFPGDAGTVLAAGASRRRSVDFTLPAGVAGTGRFVVTVAPDSNVSGSASLFEVDAAGNPSAPMASQGTFTTTEHVYPNLAVASVGAPSSAASGGRVTVTWSVANGGQADANGSWVDRVVLIGTDANGANYNQTLGNLTHVGPLAAGAGYAASLSVQIPSRLEGNFRIAVVTDAGGAVLEPDTRADNTRLSGPIAIAETYTQLVPALDTVPAQLYARIPATFGWSVRNDGTLGTDAATWVDQVWLSPTPTLAANARLLGSVTHVGAVDAGASYTSHLDFTPPSDVVGTWYFIVKADAFGSTYLGNHAAANVSAAATTTTVLPEPQPDLVVDTLSPSTDSWRAGTTVQLTYSISNHGNANAAGFLVETLRLVDPTGQRASVNLPYASGVQRDLAPGASFTRTVNVHVPDTVAPGAWRVELTADGGHVLNEPANALRTAASAITLTAPDLTVDGLATAGTLQGGRTVTLGWMSRNLGNADALPYTERVYLTRNGAVDGNAVLLGSVSHDGVAAGAAAASQLTFQLPVPASGAYQLVVVADPARANDEAGALANNSGVLAIDVAVNDYAVLTVSDIQAPVQVIDDPASVTVRWTVTNNGVGPGSTSSWTDKVIYTTADSLADARDAVVLGTWHHDGPLAAGASYTGAVTYRFPAAYARHGNIFVVSDADHAVWQNGQTAGNTLKSAQPLDVMPRPYADLMLSSVTVGGNAVSGQPLAIGWNIANRGIGVTDSSSWSDRVWLASQPDGGGTTYQLGTVSHLGQLAVDEGYTGALSAVLPQGISGTWYVFVAGADSGAPFELNHTGDARGASGAVAVTLAPSPDLQVQSIAVQDTVHEGELMPVTWTVVNNGDAAGAGPWTDTLYLVPTAGGAPVAVGSFTYTQALDRGVAYTRTQDIRIPAHMTGSYRLRVVTNASHALYEYGAAAANNVLDSQQAIDVMLQPRPELQVTGITVPDRVTAGTLTSVSFQVSNNGPVEAAGRWTDNVYLSLNGKLDANAVLVASLPNGSALPSTASYTSQTASFTVPLRYSGPVYVLVQTDANNNIDEFPVDGDNVVSKVFQVDSVPFADLVMSDVAAPDQLTYGSTFNVAYTVTNKGSAATRAADGSDRETWTDTVWLTTSTGKPSPSKGDILLATTTHSGALDVGESYQGSLSVTLPGDVRSGQYHLTMWTNPLNVIAQTTLASNVNPDDPTTIYSDNYKARAVDVIGVGVPDLNVSAVQAPASAQAGTEYSFSYTVRNSGDNGSGAWTDQVYLADDPDLTKATHRWLLGTYERNQGMTTGQTYTVSDTVLLGPQATGRYLVVQTDVLNRMSDVTRTNNAKAVNSVVTDAPADLRVTSVHGPDTEIASGEPTTITYTVTNDGAAVWNNTKSWIDNIYFSPDPTFIPGRATLLASVVHDNAAGLGAGQSYTTTANVAPPPGTEGPYYIYVIANNDPNYRYGSTYYRAADQALSGGRNADAAERFRSVAYEGTSTANNVGQGVIDVVYKEPALHVDTIAVSDPNPVAGETVTITWTVQNTGNRATRVNGWYDGVFLSHGTSIAAGDYPLVSDGSQIERLMRVRATTLTDAEGKPRYLQPGESYTNTATVTLPTSISGDFNLIVKASTDIGKNYENPTPSDIRTGLDTVAQFDRTGAGGVPMYKNAGKNVSWIALPISAAVPPNLRVADVTAPATVTAGQDLHVQYTIANRGGATPPDQSTWTDLVYLSRDRNLDLSRDTLLGYATHGGGLAADGTTART